MSNRFKLIAEECGRVIGFANPNVPDDYYALEIGSTLVVLEPSDLSAEGPGIMLATEVGEFQDEIPTQVLRVLLGANIGFEFTQGATIGLAPDQTKVVLSRILSPGIDTGEKLAEQLNRFVDLAEYWQTAIAEMAKYEPESEPSLGGFDPSINMLQV